MRIDRFGAEYATAYQFPQNMMVDTFVISRPPVYARVGGLPGAFDFYGDDNFPFEPFTLKKQFLLQAAGDYAAVESLIAALRAATIALTYETKLWLLRRDSATRWAWAKCTSLNVSEAGQDYFALTATVEFLCREGVWHT